MDGDELGFILEKALARIAPDKRAVLVLHVVEQMNYESIASTLHIPIGTVRSRLNRARRALRELLNGPLPEEYHVRKPVRPARLILVSQTTTSGDIHAQGSITT